MAPKTKKIARSARRTGKDNARATGSTKQQAGRPANMPDMPMDVLLEIFGYLHPRDLLNLARTNKGFRRYLMSRSSAFLWKAARKCIDGFPDCPSYLSEPAYANLAFFSHCHNCLKDKVEAVMWILCARYCTKCKKLKTRTYYNGFPSYPQKNLDLVTLVPYLYINFDVIYLEDEVSEVVEKLCAVTDDPAKECLYIEERKALVQERIEYSQKCTVWFRSNSPCRAEELQAIRDARFADILEKLRHAGWGEELKYMKRTGYKAFKEDEELYAQIRVAKPLDRDAWGKMRYGLLWLMADSRRVRKFQQREIIFGNSFAAFVRFVSDYYEETASPADIPLLPQPVDLAYMQEVRDILEFPNTVMVTIKNLRALLPSLPTMITLWQAHAKAKFTSLVAKKLDIPEGIDALGLAVAVFRCSGCRKTDLRYPDVVAHACLRPPVAPIQRQLQAAGEVTYEILVTGAAQLQRWSSAKVKFLPSHVKPVLEACGMPLEKTTAEEMDGLDLRFRLKHPSKSSVHGLKTWREASSSVVRKACLPWEVVSDK
ncbi:hypothetical protein B0H21DRAFT_767726 [Amylocystis lapponica]|nr:hypothetical protein B0H21DRAFT_767726 [Amylocystis lapponica]